MPGASAWEVQTRELIARVENEIASLEAETAKRIAILGRKKEALEESLLTYQEMYMTNKPAALALTPEDIRDKSQREILSLIASRNGGLLVANQAVKLMRDAGVFGNPDNASSSVYSVLKRATKEFERVGQGVYKLRGVSGVTAKPSIGAEERKTAKGKGSG
jgi:hypothetical protein